MSAWWLMAYPVLMPRATSPIRISSASAWQLNNNQHTNLTNNNMGKQIRKIALFAVAGALAWAALGGLGHAFAQEAAAVPEAAAEAAAPEAVAVTAEFIVNNLWMMMAAALVFIMHLGVGSPGTELEFAL